MIVLSGLILSLHACSFLPSSPLSTPPDEPITETQEPITKEADLPENTPPEAPEPEPLAEIEESSIHGIGSQHKYEFGVLMTTDKTKPAYLPNGNSYSLSTVVCMLPLLLKKQCI